MLVFFCKFRLKIETMIWNPTEGIAIGSFLIRYYSLMFVVAFFLGWVLMKKIYERENESIEKLDTLFIWTVFATLIGARLGHVFFYDWEYYRNHLVEIILPVRFDPEFEFTGFQGLASHGAAIAVIVTMYFYSQKIVHRPLLWILDRITIPVALGGVFVRLGNFFNSEIIGHETTASTGIRFIRDTFSPADAVRITNIANPNQAYDAIAHNPEFGQYLALVPAKHPTQLYEAFGYIFVFAAMYYLYWKTEKRFQPGYLFGLFLIMLWGVRFIVEFVKESQGGFETALGNSLSTGQWLSIPFILVGIYLMLRAKRQPATL